MLEKFLRALRILTTMNLSNQKKGGHQRLVKFHTCQHYQINHLTGNKSDIVSFVHKCTYGVLNKVFTTEREETFQETEGGGLTHAVANIGKAGVVSGGQNIINTCWQVIVAHLIIAW